MRSKPFQAFVVIVLVGVFLQGFWMNLIPVTSIVFYIGVFVVALLVAIVIRARQGSSSKGSRSSIFGSSEFLCDGCKYNDPRDCNRPERPNASRCPDYKRR